MHTQQAPRKADIELDNKLTVVVFGGANYGNNPDFQDIAYRTGELIAKEGFELANGAGLGLMEEVSKGAKENGGKVFGVGLKGKEANQYLDVYHERVGIHSRQSYLFARGHGFIVLPGGMGTLYECVEIVELKKLGEVEQEPVVVLNHKGFFDEFKNQLQKMREQGFIPSNIDQYLTFVDTPEEGIKIIKDFYKI